jgi:hypothetical protein
VDSFELGELKIVASEGGSGEPIALLWQGRSLDRHPARAIVPFVGTVLEEAQRRQTGVRLHFENLEFMNSSTITAVIQIIREARTKSVGLEIVFDRSVEWQRLSFDALAVLLRGDDLLRLVGEPARSR